MYSTHTTASTASAAYSLLPYSWAWISPVVPQTDVESYLRLSAFHTPNEASAYFYCDYYPYPSKQLYISPLPSVFLLSLHILVSSFHKLLSQTAYRETGVRSCLLRKPIQFPYDGSVAYVHYCLVLSPFFLDTIGVLIFWYIHWSSRISWFLVSVTSIPGYRNMPLSAVPTFGGSSVPPKHRSSTCVHIILSYFPSKPLSSHPLHFLPSVSFNTYQILAKCLNVSLSMPWSLFTLHLLALSQKSGIAL